MLMRMRMPTQGGCNNAVVRVDLHGSSFWIKAYLPSRAGRQNSDYAVIKLSEKETDE